MDHMLALCPNAYGEVTVQQQVRPEWQTSSSPTHGL